MEKAFTKILSIALGVITDRLITIISMGMTFGLATWIMNDPNWTRFAAFAFFSVTVFLPCLYKERNHELFSQRKHQEADVSE